MVLDAVSAVLVASTGGPTGGPAADSVDDGLVDAPDAVSLVDGVAEAEETAAVDEPSAAELLVASTGGPTGGPAADSVDEGLVEAPDDVALVDVTPDEAIEDEDAAAVDEAPVVGEEPEAEAEVDPVADEDVPHALCKEDTNVLAAFCSCCEH